MTLLKSISGIRGTIGGKPGKNLTPVDIVRFSAAYAEFIIKRSENKHPEVVLGRDSRISGDMVNNIVTGTLLSKGINVLDIGLSTTPTVEIAVTESGADGGIIMTASHNPEEWNALKLLNEKGEFISAEEGTEILRLADDPKLSFSGIYEIGKYEYDEGYIATHIEKIKALPLVDIEAVRRANFSVAIDCVNSTGGIVLPELLNALGINKINEIYCEPDGVFPHNPEPLPENITELCNNVKKNQADVGFAVDPDVDRLAIVSENGEPFGEEYTLVAVSDYVLKNKKGNTVSNLSSSRALKDITLEEGGKYYASAVGEVNVVDKMKEVNAVIGGEGNGGVIYPDLHYGRDALVGIALFLSHLAKSGKKCSELRKQYPDYYISKNKIKIKEGSDIDSIIEKVTDKYKDQHIDRTDGVKIDMEREWVHLRKSNTEPVIRIISESKSQVDAKNLSNKVIAEIESFML